MSIESLVPMMNESLRRNLLYALEQDNSYVLRHLGERFPQVVRLLPTFESVNFYETQESPTAKQTDGKWAMDGPLELLVKPFSATQGKL